MAALWICNLQWSGYRSIMVLIQHLSLTWMKNTIQKLSLWTTSRKVGHCQNAAKCHCSAFCPQTVLLSQNANHTSLDTWGSRHIRGQCNNGTARYKNTCTRHTANTRIDTHHASALKAQAYIGLWSQKLPKYEMQEDWACGCNWSGILLCKKLQLV